MLRKIWVVVLGVSTYTVMVQQVPASEMSVLAMQGRPVATHSEVLDSLDNVEWGQAIPVKVDTFQLNETQGFDDLEQATDDLIFRNEDDLNMTIDNK